MIRNYGFSTSDDVSDEAGKCNVSDYTISRGLYANADNGTIPRDKWSVQWGLRTATDGVSFWYGSDHYAAVDKNGKRLLNKNSDGSINSYGDWVGRLQGVRPAMKIDLSSSEYIYAGTYCTDGTYSDGTRYSLDGCDVSHDLRFVEALDSTYDSVGHKQYWICDKCGKVFADSDGKKEVSYSELSLPMLSNLSTTPAPVQTTKPIIPSDDKDMGTISTEDKPDGVSSGNKKPAETDFQVPKEMPSFSPTEKPLVEPSDKPSPSPSILPIASSDPGSTDNPIESEPTIVSSGVITIKGNGVTYVVKGSAVEIKRVKNQKCISIRKTVKIGRKTFKVSHLKKGLFAKKKKIRKVIMEVDNIKCIDKGAFSGLSKESKIQLKGSKKRIRLVKSMIRRSGLSSGIKVLT